LNADPVLRDLPEVLEALHATPPAGVEGFELVSSDAESALLRRSGVTALLALPSRLRAGAGTDPVQEAASIVFCLGPAEELSPPPEQAGRGPSVLCIPLPVPAASLWVTLTSTLDLVAKHRHAEEQAQLAEQYRFELGELISIGAAINSERDINRLLGLILEKSRYVSGADAGSIYVLVPNPERPREEKLLRFAVAQNESVAIDFNAFTLAVSRRSIVGAAVLSREVINIPDLAALSRHNPWGVEHDRSFDDRTGYRTRSLLTVPLITTREEVVGVLQLINKKRVAGARLRTPRDFDDGVLPFDPRSVELCKTLASQAAIALENAILYDELRQAFEGFVSASVQAIESRDPTTSGHSRRVADLTLGLAEAVSRKEIGIFREVSFTKDDLREIEYAGLLHDFGKIGVPEPVLVKANKLYDWELERILSRFSYIRSWIEADALKRKLEAALKAGALAAVGAGPGGGPSLAHQLESMDRAKLKQLEYLNLCVQTVVRSNRPSVEDAAVDAFLTEIANQVFTDEQGEERTYLTGQELDGLRVKRGSLNSEERRQIEAHVVHTFNFLRSIPWGRALSEIPAIAGAHHEKLDGSGYPGKLSGGQIAIQTRMMTISDIFDALTSSDRPYKRAVPYPRALDILLDEVKQGKLDRDLYDLFVEARVWSRVLPEKG
jgi:HD-GYP domain-containing protein (c-di-GMP phosphodiesterase class II)